MLDLSSLALTDEEQDAILRPLKADEDCCQPIADAQLRKAVEGIVAWLESGTWEGCCPAHSLEDMLAAGIPQEGEGG